MNIKCNWKVLSLISVCRLHRLIWNDTLRTCIKPGFPRMRLLRTFCAKDICIMPVSPGDQQCSAYLVLKPSKRSWVHALDQLYT